MGWVNTGLEIFKGAAAGLGTVVVVLTSLIITGLILLMVKKDQPKEVQLAKPRTAEIMPDF